MVTKPRPTEQQLRRQLGIPPDARRVLILGETSHWDPNWLLTSEQYYGLRVKRILDGVLRVLVAEPRRIFSIESLFFLRLYWEREPGRRDILRQLVNEGRLALSGTGITTPDTVLPSAEAILRDFLSGQEWLRDRGMTQEPRLAYFPDDFGHSPMIPTLLDALGLEQVGITRVDGMYFVGSDFRLKGSFPLPGSSAQLLAEQEKTLDFVWQSPDGAEVLAHWNAFTYFQGDMLAHLGVIRWMGLSFGVPWRTEAHVARRIDGFVRQLLPLARTPYLFCPIGCDFNGPIEGLLGLLDRHNRNRYPDTGVWVVNAGLESYLDLVSFYRGQLPVVQLDPNPYWMGFYASRPALKGRCNRIVHKLRLAERLSATDADDPDPRTRHELRQAWDRVVVSNHHDYITGTSPDRVWLSEQLPWLIQAETLADRALGRQLDRIPPASPPRRCLAPTPRWSLVGRRLEVETQHYRLALDGAVGGCIIGFELKGLRLRGSRQLLAGPANDLVSYRDSGGLWRMGQEYRGGTFKESARGAQRQARIEVEELEDAQLEVRVFSRLEGRPFVRWLWLSDETPVIRMRLSGSAAERRTVTCCFPTRFRAFELVMDVPGGVVRRPTVKLYRPTFWPARTFAHLDEGGGLAVIMGGPACVGCTEPGILEWVVLRNAPAERAFGLLPLPAHPASGADPSEHRADYAVLFTPGGDHLSNQLARRAKEVLSTAWLAERTAGANGHGSAVWIDRNDVLITAVKRASRGAGLVTRLTRLSPKPVLVRLHCDGREVREALLCDAMERDRAALQIIDGAVLVPVSRNIVSVRLIF